MTDRVSVAARLGAALPVLDWGRRYSRADLAGDGLAAVIVTIMLIPQSLAYALLAGLPPEVGLYASILPLVAYAVFGTSRTLAVGPVAVASLMTASALAPLGLTTVAEAVAAAGLMALMSGGMLLAMGVLRMGWVADFLSHPVIAGFITASGILIAASQARHLIGVLGGGHTLPEILHALWEGRGAVNLPTLALGLPTLAFLLWARRGLAPALLRTGIGPATATALARTGPVLAVAATTVAVWALDLGAAGVATVGAVPGGLPPLGLPVLDLGLVQALALPALLISIIGFVESVSVAQTLAAKRRQRIDPNQELLGLGAANVAAGVSGGYPVTGGFARSVVNFDAGARTPAAGAMTAVGLTFAALFLTPLLYHLPTATLAATIIAAVLSLVDLSILRRAWAYSRADFAAVAVTIALTLTLGVEIGVGAGVAVSLALILWKTAHPHVAEVGRVPGGEHFRNILRHAVETDPGVLTLRVDESLTFANARRLEDLIQARVTGDAGLRHVVLMCTAVNEIDLSALESLEAINARLTDLGLTLHLSEVKGPVMDRLQRSHFLDQLTGEVFLSQHQAFEALRGAPPRAA
ncbi:sulfate permease [Rhodobacteraceae bacterium CCMM004]|nr:sulfate permease [Rhodobacteraceae bacterium CCMM004]